MFKPDDPSAVSGQYVDGVPGGAHGTAIRADHLNAITNEITNVVEGAGITLAKANSAQLLAALQALGNRNVELLGITSWRNLHGVETTVNMSAITSSPLGVLSVGRVGDPAPMRFLPKAADFWESPAPAGGFPGTFKDTCWSPAFARFIAVGSDQTGGGGGSNNEIQDSTSGSNGWTHRTIAGAGLNACAAGISAVVAVGNSGFIASTTNGTAWTSRTSAHAGVHMFGVAYSPTLNRFVAVGASGKIQRSDATGTTWAAATSPTTNAFLDQGIIWSAEASLFFAWTLTEVYKSSDGLAWTSATGPVSAWPAGGGAGISKVIALPVHLAVFYNTYPLYVKMYRIAELDGSPASVVDNINLVPSDPDAGGFDRPEGIIRVPPASGYIFAGCVLVLCQNGRIRVTPYIG